ncbi:MAG TPA: hypothetical protein VN842_03685, partial [Thermoplasmata archaeon]|nr:hypothetical protein [Thermoplasmata archaeon]
EEAYFALTSRYVADNGQVAATALGTNLTDGNDTFEYQPSYFGSFTPVLSLPLTSLSFGVVHGGITTSKGIDVGGVVRLHPVGPMSFSLTYIEPGFNVTVTVVIAPNAPLASFRITATADPGYGLRSLSGNLSGKGDVQLGNVPGSFEVTPGRYGQALATYVLVRPSSALTGLDTGQHAGKAPRAGFHVTNPAGDLDQPLGVNFSFATVGASSLVPGLPSLITTDTTFANWSIRFVLYSSANAAGLIGNLLPHEISYLQSEYGAKVLGRVGHWTVVMLPPPSQLPTAPWPTPTPS